MKTTASKVFRIVLTVLIACTLLFTFYQSLLPEQKSIEVSNTVSEKLEPAVPKDTEIGKSFHANIRKIAHFVEFAALGLFVGLYVALFIGKDAPLLKRAIGMLLSYLAALGVALFDETLQIFSSRGSSVADVWLDLFGFAFSATIVYAVTIIVSLIRSHKRQQN